MTENMLPLYIIASVYLFMGSMHWESRLIAQFGEAYKRYQQEVPRMIPLKGRKC
jgi:protein-S-isoprenylcysteine O-methyltransferase Ste14